jgi:ATP-binding cassette, subfamily B, bacterial
MTKLPSKLTQFYWHFIRKRPISFAIFFISPCIMVLEVTIIPYGLKLIIDAIEQNLHSRELIFETIKPALYLIAIAWTAQVVVSRLQNWWQGYVLPGVEGDIRMSVVDHMLNHSYHYFTSKLAGKIASKINDLPRALESIRMIISWMIIATSATVIASLIILYFVKPIFALILLIWVIIHSMISYFFAPIINNASKENAKDRSELNGKIVDTITNIMSLKLFARKEYELSYIGISQRKEMVSNKGLILSLNLLRWLFEIPILILLGVTLYFLIIYWQTEQITSGDFVLIINIVLSITGNLWNLGHALADLAKETGVAKQSLELIHAPFDIEDKKDAVALRAQNGEIEFHNVTFNYQNNSNLFENKNIKIKAGEKVGLVGFSGSGKTTFVNLILRFFDIQFGKITIDGQSISDVTQDSLRENITVIPQDTSLFHRTLMENIKYGNVYASDDEVYQAAKDALCEEFIEQLPENYLSLVGERGVKLSGGQKQRIAIARAMLKKAPILILDEATSALDSMTEKYIQESLHKLMQNKTTIIIAHRLSTLAEVDRVLVFNKGEIIEDGSHDELIRKNGHYRKLWQMQANGFLPENDDS